MIDEPDAGSGGEPGNEDDTSNPGGNQEGIPQGVWIALGVFAALVLLGLMFVLLMKRKKRPDDGKGFLHRYSGTYENDRRSFPPVFPSTHAEHYDDYEGYYEDENVVTVQVEGEQYGWEDESHMVTVPSEPEESW